jgi:hypothetical protein
VSRKRKPVAEIGAEDYRIVRHTHDVHEAADLMSTELREKHGCPGDGAGNYCDIPDPAGLATCRHEHHLGKAVQVWVRIVPALPNSYAAAEGLTFTYNGAKPHSPGAFRAVEFR